MKEIKVMWVGLSLKKKSDCKDFEPLDIETNSGKLIAEIEFKCERAVFFKTNLVKFSPLDSNGKMRYPTQVECAMCYPELETEINYLEPKIIFLLGDQVSTFILNKIGKRKQKLSYEAQVYYHDNRLYIPIHHPSYIMIYKRKEKDKYILGVKSIIEKIKNAPQEY